MLLVFLIIWQVRDIVENTIQVDMKMALHGLLKPLLLLLLVVNIPSCWSVCDIDSARQCALDGKCKTLSTSSEKVVYFVNSIIDQASVEWPTILEAYQVCELFVCWIFMTSQ